MTQPTPDQARVLKAVQTRSVVIAELLTLAKAFDGLAPRAWLVSYHHHAIAREDLAAAAVAAGIPRTWIDRVRACGDTGIGWDAMSALGDPGPIDWDRILTDLTTDVARIQDWVALDTAYGQLGYPARDCASAGLRTGIDAVLMRTTGVVNLLGLPSDLTVELWGDLSDWARYGAAILDGVAAEQIVHRWHAATEFDTRAYAGQASVLVADAAIPIDIAAAIPVIEDLRAAINNEFGRVRPQFVSSVTAMSSTVKTAMSPSSDVPANVVFSTPLDFDQPWKHAAGHAQVAPVFSNMDGAHW